MGVIPFGLPWDGPRKISQDINHPYFFTWKRTGPKTQGTQDTKRAFIALQTWNQFAVDEYCPNDAHVKEQRLPSQSLRETQKSAYCITPGLKLVCCWKRPNFGSNVELRNKTLSERHPCFELPKNNLTQLMRFCQIAEAFNNTNTNLSKSCPNIDLTQSIRFTERKSRFAFAQR